MQQDSKLMKLGQVYIKAAWDNFVPSEANNRRLRAESFTIRLSDNTNVDVDCFVSGKTLNCGFPVNGNVYLDPRDLKYVTSWFLELTNNHGQVRDPQRKYLAGGLVANAYYRGRNYNFNFHLPISDNVVKKHLSLLKLLLARALLNQ